MALSLNQTAALARFLRPFKTGLKIAACGYPDIIAPLPMLETLHDLGKLEYRADSEAICKRHGLKDRKIPDAHSFFGLFGVELDVYDVVQERGCEIILDLNYEQMQPWQYDIVLDVGTAEHCFNIGQALINMAGMVKKGGHIIHENPHSGYSNHGFYSLHPTLFNDFYTANGFEIINLMLTTKSGDSYECHPTQRMSLDDLRDVNVFCMAKRVEIKPFSFPIQTKYRKT